jgi:hypothetical protein
MLRSGIGSGKRQATRAKRPEWSRAPERRCQYQTGATEGRRDERADAAAQALVTAGKSLRRLAGAFFTGNGAIQHSDTRNARSP